MNVMDWSLSAVITGQTLGARLRQLRKDRMLTLARLALAARISVSYLKDIRQDRTVPTLGPEFRS